MTEMPGDIFAGRLYAEVQADTSGLARELRRKINAEIRGVKAQVKAEIDSRGLRTAAQRAAREASDAAKVRLKAELDTRGLVTQARTAAREASRAAVVRVKMELDTRGFTGKVVAATVEARRAAEAVSNVKFTADTGGMAAEVVAAATAARTAARGDVKIGADTSSAAGAIGALGQQAARTTGNLPFKFNPADMVSARGVFGMLTRTLGSGGAIAVAGGALAGLVSAAVNAAGGLFSVGAAATQAAGSLAILPNLIGVAAQGLGSLMIGFSGIGEAVKALGQTEQAQAQASGQAAEQRRAAQEAVRAAHEQVRDAARAVQDAERGVADAQRSAAAAARAIEDAERNVADAHRAVADAIRERNRAVEESQEANGDAAEAVRDSLEGVSDAERGVERAQQATLDAQNALNDARQAARDRIRDLNFELSQSATREGAAALALRQAREALQDVNWDATSSSTEQVAAQQAVDEAMDNLKRVRRENRDLADETAEANRKGVAGSDEVAQARQALLDAQEAETDAIEAHSDAVEALSDAERERARTAEDGAQSIADAERGVEDARRGVADATRAVADAERNYRDAARGVADARRAVRDAERGLVQARRNLNQAERDAKKPAEAVTTALQNQKDAFENLSPEARRFARFIYEKLRPRMYEFREAVQAAILPPIRRGINKAMPFLDTLQEGMVESGRVVGRWAEKLGRLLGSEGFNADVRRIMRSNNRAMERFGDAGLSLIDIFRDLAHEARPLVRRFSAWVEQLFKGWRRSIKVKRETGELRDFFDKAGDAAATLGDIIGNVFGAIGGMGKAAAPSGKTLLDTLADTTERWDKWVNSDEGQKRLREFFENAKEVTRELADLIANMSKFIGLFSEGSGGTIGKFLGALNELIELMNDLLALPGVSEALFGSPLLQFIERIKKLPETFDKVYNAIVTGAEWVYDKLFGHSVFPDLLAGLRGWGDDVRQWARKRWDEVTGWVTNPVEKAKDGVAKWWDRIKRRFEKGREDGVTWSDRWEKVEDWMAGPVGRAKDGISKWWDKTENRFGDARDWVANRWEKQWNKVRTFMADPVDNGRKAIGDWWGRIEGRFTAARDWVANRWSTRWDKVQNWLEDPVSNAKTGIGGILDDIRSGFDTAVTKIGNIWDRLRKLTSDPVNFVINDVYNDGIRKLVNKVWGFFSDNDEVLPPAEPVRRRHGGVVPKPSDGRTTQGVQAATGAVLPGWSPGRDIHEFASPTGGRLALSGGEAVMRPEWTRAVGPEWVNRLNIIARKGGVRGVRKAMALVGHHALGGIMRFARGGVFDPTDKVRIGDDYLTRISAAQIALAGRLGNIPMSVMQGSWRPYTDYSGTSHMGPGGVADTGPGSFKAQYWLRKVGMAAWARNIPGAAAAGSGAHVHSVSRIDPTTRDHAQLSSWSRNEDGLGGSDYGSRPPLVKGLRDMLARFGPIRLAAGGGDSGGGIPWWLEKAISSISGFVDNAIENIPGADTGMGRMMTMGAKAMFEQAKDWIANKVASFGGRSDYNGPVSGSVRRFADIVRTVLKQLHQPEGALDSVLHRMAQESSGNVRAVNNWDSNAANGTPSVGLMQLIGGTYRAYKPRNDKGPYLHGVSVDPYSNIYAGVNYGANDSYHGYDKRSLVSVMMQPGGYDDGGWLYPPINGTGQPEAVLDNDESAAFVALGRLAAEMRGNIRDTDPAAAAAGALIDHLELTVGDRRDLPEALRLLDTKLRVIRRGGVHARRIARTPART